MAINDVATAAYNVFPMDTIQTPYGAFSLPVVMTAIAGAEDGFGNGPGDPGIENTCNPPGTLCNGYGSFGPWQISLSCNGNTIAAVSGIPTSDPCGQANWLTDYQNCAQVALAIYQAGGGGTEGFKSWCTWWGDGRCGVEGGAPGYGPYHQYLAQAQQAINQIVSSVSSPPPLSFAPPPVSQWFLWAGGILFAGGLALLGWEWWQNRRTPSYGFARLVESHDTDTKINPDYLTYIAPTQEDVSEVTEPLNACTVYDRVKRALQERGVAVVENRSMPPNTEAFYTDEGGDRILLSPSVSLLAKECNPYATQTLLHEGTHALLHNSDCMPSFRGQMYTSVAHQVEEQEAELASLATMVRLGLPVETYDGTVIPPGRAEVAWERAKRDLDPVTYENVRWASDWLTRAARGEDGSLVSEKCPPARLVERR